MQREHIDAPVHLVRDAVAGMLREQVPVDAGIVLGLSGGRDSVVLLDALAAVADGRTLVAAHVHHGLSAHADEWATFCAGLCTQRGIAYRERRITIQREPRQSLEGEARRMRYAALADIAGAEQVGFVALAHHRDDQAETLLLQLLRGAGPHGLAAMPPVRVGASGIAWLRPLLGVTRADIDAYAARRALAWVEDDSNARDAHLRNALRHRVIPALAALAPAYGTTLHRAAAHQAEAARLADDLAALDASAAAGDGATLDRATLAALPPHRARNLLRWFLRRCELPAPSTARLDAMLVQLRTARADAQVRLAHAGVEVGVHRGRVVVHATPASAFDLAWQGEDELLLPHGVLTFQRVDGAGVDAARLQAEAVRVRSRAGGERIQVRPEGPRRALKALLREAAIAPWERDAWPLVYCGTVLAAVPGILVAGPFRAAPDRPGVDIAWRPRFTRAARPSATAP
jgi:tRNA(Ile)-lysidine synthase